MPHNVMVVGSGGREFEITRQLAMSPKVKNLFIAPGNGGTSSIAKTKNVDISVTDSAALIDFSKKYSVDTIVIGPDLPLAVGVADDLRGAGLAVFGPSKKAAQLESSKSFATKFMSKHGIPQPRYWVAHTLKEALNIIEGRPAQSYVIKADGLAAGKGVVLPKSDEQAKDTLNKMFSGKLFGDASKKVVFQERLHGPEISAFAISDGTNFVTLPYAQDHKRLRDKDEGPNTGGIGAYCPVPSSVVSADQDSKIRKIIKLSIEGMAKDNNPFCGALYIGLMLSEENAGDPVVIEYNARFGDPETQVLLPVLSEAGCSVAEILLAAAHNDVSSVKLPKKYEKVALTVCLSSFGYPEDPLKGDIIKGLDKTYQNVVVQQAGTKKVGQNIVTSGGRVIFVTAIDDNFDTTADLAYKAIGTQGIYFKDMQFRSDIGYQVRKNS